MNTPSEPVLTPTQQDNYCPVCLHKKPCDCLGIWPYTYSRYPGEHKMVKCHPSNDDEMFYRRTEVDSFALQMAGDLERAQAEIVKLNKRDGNWIDEWGSCKLCGGEIPHGHTNNCDLYKLETEARTAQTDLANEKSISSLNAKAGLELEKQLAVAQARTKELEGESRHLNFQHDAMSGMIEFWGQQLGASTSLEWLPAIYKGVNEIPELKSKLAQSESGAAGLRLALEKIRSDSTDFTARIVSVGALKSTPEGKSNSGTT